MAVRTFLTALTVLVAILAGVYQLRYKDFVAVIGVGRVVENVGSRDCKVIPELQACEKIKLHQPTGMLYLACSSVANRRAWTPTLLSLNTTARFGPDADEDYVATYDPRSSRITRIKPTGLPASPPLSLHGMDVVPSSRDPKELFIYLVNHRPPLLPDGTYADAAAVGANSTIEVFSARVGGHNMQYLRTYHAPGVIVSPNDVVGLPDGEGVYFTNDAGAKTGMAKRLPMLLRLADTSVGFCHATRAPGCKIASAPLHDANGIAAPLSLYSHSDNTTFYVANALKGTVTALEMQSDDTLVMGDVIPVGKMIDNLSVDSAGHLWGGSLPTVFPLDKAMSGTGPVTDTPVPGAALRITLNTGAGAYYGEKYRVETVIEDDGALVSGTTSAAYDAVRGRLFMHGLVSPHLTVCKA